VTFTIFFATLAAQGEFDENDQELFEAALLRYIYVIQGCQNSNEINEIKFRSIMGYLEPFQLNASRFGIPV